MAGENTQRSPRIHSGSWTVLAIIAVAGTLLISGLAVDGIFSAWFKAAKAIIAR